jgi:hypothetical protein
MADVCHACGRALPRRRIEARDMEQTGWGCPTVFDWTDQRGNTCYFRLRNGFWPTSSMSSPSTTSRSKTKGARAASFTCVARLCSRVAYYSKFPRP